MISLFVVNTSTWLNHWKAEENEVRTYFKTYEYDAETEIDCLLQFVQDMNESNSELYLQSVKVHHMFVYQDFDASTLRVVTDITPYEKFFKRIKCYDWS